MSFRIKVTYTFFPYKDEWWEGAYLGGHCAITPFSKIVGTPLVRGLLDNDDKKKINDSKF